MAAPVKLHEEVELQVDSLAYGGNGVARLNGFVVFVRRGLPGDRVRARVTKVKRGFAEALATEVLEPSAQRVEAPCAHYPACGGCRFQDLDYAVQVAAKEAQVRDALVRIGGLADPPLEPILPAASPFHYRNKLEYSFTQTPSGPALGFHKAGRWDEVLEIEKCWLTTDLGNAIRNAVRDWAREEGLVAYDQAEHTGYLRHLVFREGRNTGQVLAMLVTHKGEKFERDYFVEVLRRFPEIRSIHWAINDGQAEVTNLPSTLLWGEDAIEEEILGLRFRVRPNAFLQTNTEMAEQLYALAIEYANLTGSETVYDLYCGTGTIGLALAKDALSVWGVEISEESVACALENADLNEITNAAFFAGNVGQSIEELVERAGSPDVVVVDPPRAGLAGKALKRTGALGASRIVYVSCNPTTLASDVKVLRAEYGYELMRARAVDMFPHTPHVETVALLEADLASLAHQPLDLRFVGGELLGMDVIDERRALVVRHHHEPVRQLMDAHRHGLGVGERQRSAGQRDARVPRRPLARQEHDPAGGALDHVRVEVVHLPVGPPVDPHRRPASPAERLPDQVGVREQEAEADRRQRRQARHVRRDGEDEGGAEQARHPEPRPRDSQPEAIGRAEEEREEEDVRRAEIRARVRRLARDPKRDRHLLEDPGLLRDDVVRRPSPHRDGVDPGNEQRDQHRPGERLEVGEEPESERGQREELREVEEDVELGEPEEHREDGQRRADKEEPAARSRSQRQHEPDHRRRRREEHEDEERDVRGEPAVPEQSGPGAVRREPERDAGERQRPRPTQESGPAQ